MNTTNNEKSGLIEVFIFGLQKLGEAFFGVLILFLGTFVIVNIPLYVLRWSESYSNWIHYGAITFCLCYLGATCWFLTHKNYFSNFRKDHFVGKVLPLIVVLSFFMLASGCFGGLSAELAKHGNATLVPIPYKIKSEIVTPTATSAGDVTDFYLWHALDLIPAMDIPETIGWGKKFEYTDSGTGWLLLLFKGIIVWVAIGSIKRWSEWLNPKQQK